MNKLKSVISVILALILLVLIIVSYVGLTGIFIYFFINLFLNHFDWYVPLIWLGIDGIVVIILLVVTFFLSE